MDMQTKIVIAINHSEFEALDHVNTDLDDRMLAGMSAKIQGFAEQRKRTPHDIMKLCAKMIRSGECKEHAGTMVFFRTLGKEMIDLLDSK